MCCCGVTRVSSEQQQHRSTGVKNVCGSSAVCPLSACQLTCEQLLYVNVCRQVLLCMLEFAGTGVHAETGFELK
jgi:hypothetical protein